MKLVPTLSLICMLVVSNYLDAAVKSTTGSINFDSNNDVSYEMVIQGGNLGIGTTSPSSNLHVMGNSIVSGTLNIGTTSGQSNLNVGGTIGTNFELVSSNVTLGSNSYVLADTSSGNLTLTIPSANTLDGRLYTIKKTSVSNDLLLKSTSSIDGQLGLILSSNTTMPSVSLIASSGNWYSINFMNDLYNTVSQVQFDLSSYFNMDMFIGPSEYTHLKTMGTADSVDVYGQAGNTHGYLLFAPASTYSKYYLVGNSSTGVDYFGSYLTQGTPSNGVLTSPSLTEYHMASIEGNDTLSGNWLEVSDVSSNTLKPNAIAVGAYHNIANWQISEANIILPAAQQKRYFAANAVFTVSQADRARNMVIAARYTDNTEDILYSFSTADGGSGPYPSDTDGGSEWNVVHTSVDVYNLATTASGLLTNAAGNFNLYEWKSSFAIDANKVLKGFRIYDTNPSLNSNARVIVVYAITGYTY